MRGALFWVGSTVAAFAVTAGVFLMLAQIGANTPEQSLEDDDRRAEPRAPLSLDFGRGELDRLDEEEDQELELILSNTGSRELTDINVYLIVSPEDTASRETRYYEAEVEELDPEESKRVDFDIDLSPPDSNGSGNSSEETPDDTALDILEVRAASSEGASTVKTAVL